MKRFGFTLMEVLIALGVVGFVFSALLAVFSSTLDIVDNIDDASSERSVELIFSLLQRDLNSLYYEASSNNTSMGYYEFMAGNDLIFELDTELSEDENLEGIFLQFGTSYVIDFNSTFPGFTLAQVQYLLCSNEDDTGESHKTLIRRQRKFPNINKKWYVVELYDRILELEFEAISSTGETRTNWQTWPGEEQTKKQINFPQLIKISIKYLDAKDNSISRQRLFNLHPVSMQDYNATSIF